MSSDEDQESGQKTPPALHTSFTMLGCSTVRAYLTVFAIALDVETSLALLFALAYVWHV